jgi:hypothetical protein
MFKNENTEPGMVAYICNPNTQEAEAGGYQVQGQPGLHSTVSSKTAKATLEDPDLKKKQKQKTEISDDHLGQRTGSKEVVLCRTFVKIVLDKR